MCAAVGEQVLSIALLVVQRTQQHTGPLQLSFRDQGDSVRGVRQELWWEDENLTIMTELLLIESEGGELPEPEGQITQDMSAFIMWTMSKQRVSKGISHFGSSLQCSSGPEKITPVLRKRQSAEDFLPLTVLLLGVWRSL